MGRVPCCDENTGELKRGPWAPEEDTKLMDYIQKNGHGSWRTLPKIAGLSRCGKSCRLRWTNYLRPDIKRGRFSFEEEETIIQLHSLLGNKWATIASCLPGRTDNEIKNYWNTHVRKRLIRMGIDPVTHAPQVDLFHLHHQHHHRNHQDLIDSEQLGNSSELLTNIIANNLISAADEHQQQCSITNLQQQQQQQQQQQFLQEPQLHPLLPPSCSFQDSIPQINCPTGCNSDNIIKNSSAFNSGTTSLPIPSEQYSHVVDYDQHLASNNPSSFNQNFNFDPCVFSTPASSPSMTHLNSTTSPYNINSSNEDEKDSTCSNTGINFHIPEFLDMSEFM